MTQLDNLTSSTRNFLVAAEVTEDGFAELFFREKEEIHSEKIPFHPSFLLAESAEMADFEGEYRIVPLNGNGILKFQIIFDSMKIYSEAVDFLKKQSKIVKGAPRQFFNDLTNQILTSQQLRLFRGMKFNDIRRMQFDLETITTEGYDFPNASREGDEIIMISISDNHGFETLLTQQEYSERELLEQFIQTVQKRNPDVLEGHNICRFDLPYLEARCKRHKMSLNLGRDGKPLKKRSSFFNAAERTVDYTRYDFYGRSVVDTYHLAQFYDVIHRSLESLGLKYLARHFNVASPERTYVNGADISRVWREEPEKLGAYALDDVRECQAVSNILLPSYFFMAQIVPLKLQDCVIRGKATVIDHILTAAYLNRKESLPLPESPVPFAGALTVSPQTGVFKKVYHCDVRSLYPSIILAEKWNPRRDTLGEFTRLLENLREFRLWAKDESGKAKNNEDKDYFVTLQTTFKILINSFYGYLGSAQGSFNDYAMAEKITSRGREILHSMLDYLHENSCKVLEADTDGVYFTLPSPESDPASLLTGIQKMLPNGITIEMDAAYRAMFCYKSKNYALLTNKGELEIAGAALKSRGLEPFQRELLETILNSLLNEKYESVNEKYTELSNSISAGTLPAAWVAKTETLKDSVAVYKRKIDSGKGRRAAAYELAATSSRSYNSGDQITYYVTGEKKNTPVVGNAKLLSDAPGEFSDYNRSYYLKKLEELFAKFAEFLPAKPNTGDDLFA